MVADQVAASPLSALLALGFIALPGAALSVAVFGPGRLPLVTRLALVLPMGYAVVALLSMALALPGVLTLPTLLVGYVLTTVAGFVFAARRRSLAGQPAALRREARAEPVALALAAVVLAGFFAAILTVSPLLALADYTPLRYWADGLEVAAAGGLTDTSMQWGQLLPTASSKVALNAFDGSMSLLLGRGPLGPMAVMLAVAASAVAMAALGLARELGLTVTAPLLPLLLFANLRIGDPELTLDVHFYRAETWGRVAAFGAAALAVRALRAPKGERRLAEALVAGGLLGVGAATHLVPTAVVCGFLLLYGGVHAAFEHRLLPTLRTGGAVAATALAMGGSLLVLAPGDAGLRGPGDPGRYTEIAQRLGLPADFDPTMLLARGLVEPRAPRGGGSYDAPSETVARFTANVVGAEGRPGPPPWVVLAAAAAIVALVVVGGAPDLRTLGIVAASFGLALVAVALAFSFRYDLYALARFGERRLFDYSALAAWLLVLALVETGLRRLPGVLERCAVRRPAIRANAPQWVGAVLFLVLAAVLVPQSLRATPREDRGADVLPVLDWIERNVPCDGRVLADRRTLATFEAITGRVGVLEGMGPYFRTDVLEIALARILEAQGVLSEPRRLEPYLERNDVAAVVLTAAGQPLLGGAHRLRDVPSSRFDSLPFLERVLETDTAILYRVRTFDGGSPPPPDTPFCDED